MNRNYIFEHCSDPEKQGFSVWKFPIGKKRPLFLTTNLITMPNFDSNVTCVLIQYRRCRVLLGHEQSHFEIFFWIGSRCSMYEKNFEALMELLAEVKGIQNSQMKVHVEY